MFQFPEYTTEDQTRILQENVDLLSDSKASLRILLLLVLLLLLLVLLLLLLLLLLFTASA